MSDPDSIRVIARSLRNSVSELSLLNIADRMERLERDNAALLAACQEAKKMCESDGTKGVKWDAIEYLDAREKFIELFAQAESEREG